MRFRDCTKNERAWIIFGGVLIVVGIALMFATNTAWWTSSLVLLRRVSRIAIPVLLIVVGIYVIAGARKGNFAGMAGGQGAFGPQQGRLTRSQTDVRVAGVCGGIAQYFGIDVTGVRVIAVLLALASPLLTLIAYGILAAIMRVA